MLLWTLTIPCTDSNSPALIPISYRAKHHPGSNLLLSAGHSMLLTHTWPCCSVPPPCLGHVIPLCLFPSSFILLENATVSPCIRRDTIIIIIYTSLYFHISTKLCYNESIRTRNHGKPFGGGVEWGCENRCYKDTHSLWAWKSFGEVWKHVLQQPPTFPLFTLFQVGLLLSPAREEGWNT